MTSYSMRIIFSILSIAYIAGVFLLAGSPVVSDLSTFNPYSVLHVPLYGILTVLLIFSFVPFESKGYVSNVPSHSNQKFSTSTHSRIDALTDPSHLLIDSFTHRQFLIPGLLALGVGIADEIHQAYVPGRDASVTDVLLDLTGIILALLFIYRLLKTKKSLTP